MTARFLALYETPADPEAFGLPERDSFGELRPAR